MNQAFPTSQAATEKLNKPTGFKVWRPGLIPYRDALLCQEAQVAKRRHGSFDLLILLQHPPVITLGRGARSEHLLRSPEDLKAAGIDCLPSGRGGDITLHNPGQLVGYPIVDLQHYGRDLHRFLRLLEQILIDTLADFDLGGVSMRGQTGVWVNGRKIASIGIAVRHWISYHGFALNVDNDLTLFDTIVPCGLADVTMTSMSTELGRNIDPGDVSNKLIGHFSTSLQRTFLGNYDQSTSQT